MYFGSNDLLASTEYTEKENTARKICFNATLKYQIESDAGRFLTMRSVSFPQARRIPSMTRCGMSHRPPNMGGGYVYLTFILIVLALSSCHITALLNSIFMFPLSLELRRIEVRRSNKAPTNARAE